MRTTLLALTLLLTAGCPMSGGPCSSAAVLFPSPAASGTTTDAGVVIDVTWQPTSAPAAFYASPSATGNVRLLDAGVTGAQLISTSSSTGTLAFELRYSEGPTRTCSHLGMDDTYVLSVSVPRLTDGGVGAGSVTTSIDLGAL
ncbi:MAG: hypothetical protein Q8N23_13310 [Archangium sp.]|nr:hypothetical protein [Archangium sp.]MDP3153650.1 hypothetical protein [Archangium sp.]MDP3569302.1 hypothetical protein [Archangium sp.]